jgi:hypothetical protein
MHAGAALPHSLHTAARRLPPLTFVGAGASPPPCVDVALTLLQVHRVVIGLDVVLWDAHQRKEEGRQGNLQQQRWQAAQAKQAVTSPDLQDEVLLQHSAELAGLVGCHPFGVPLLLSGVSLPRCATGWQHGRHTGCSRLSCALLYTLVKPEHTMHHRFPNYADQIITCTVSLHRMQQECCRTI